MNTPHTCTILLAEDDLEDRSLFREAVSAAGNSISLIEVDNGQITLEILRVAVSLPDFIVLDVNMPRMNGIDCLKAIRTDPRMAEIPVIIMSTSDNPATIDAARNWGATKYAIKPTQFNDLVAIVRYICQHDLTESIGADFVLNNVVHANA